MKYKFNVDYICDVLLRDNPTMNEFNPEFVKAKCSTVVEVEYARDVPIEEVEQDICRSFDANRWAILKISGARVE